MRDPSLSQRPERKLPKLRAVEAFPVEQDGTTFICLRDPSRIAPDPILIGMGAYFLVTLLDGRNSADDLRLAFVRRFGDQLPSEHLDKLVEALDRAYFLESPRYAERMEKIRAEFADSRYRQPVLAGLCYDADPSRLRVEIEGFFRVSSGPGEIPEPRHEAAALSGLIAPHIDPRRGGPAYAYAYGELRQRQRPELVVILGTSHYGAGPELFTATRKDYMTPFGALETDRGLLDRLASRYHAGELFSEELLHRDEHSIEFQAVFLAWALGTIGFKTVPILTGSFHHLVRDGRQPCDDERVREFIAILRDELAADKRR
ncbi:MAG: AmmeMemoRadiSam system protein B, partial [Candidatus Binataceae bacterium]